MAKYVLEFQNVRTQFSPQAVGTAGTTAEVSNRYRFVMDQADDPVAAEIIAAVGGAFGLLDITDAADLIETAFAGADYTDTTEGAGSIRHGKAVLQWGIGQHATDDSLATITFKDLS